MSTSADAPPSPPGKRHRLARGILFGLLAAHTAWMCVHMYLVAVDKIDPWKLGGYGMYTIAPPKPTVRAFVRVQTLGKVKINTDDRRFRRANNGFRFKCAPIEPSTLAVLLEDNPKLRGQNFEFGIVTLEMLRDPIRMVNTPWIVAFARHQGGGSYELVQQFCGERISDTVQIG